MPWHLDHEHPQCSGWAVVKDDGGKVVGCHPTKAKAIAHMAALNMNVKEAGMDPETVSTEPPRESLYRGMWPADFALRDGEDGGPPVMFGHFARFGEWAEIESLREGHFMERLERGAFARTFDHRPTPRVLFQHGQDPQIGSKILGKPITLREEEEGAYYEVPLLDTSYNRDLLPGLREGLYGASFRFRVTREQIDNKPARSEHNPDGLPERTVKEVELHEFGPVTFPAYEGATAGIRSLTDEFLLGELVRDRDRLRQLIRYIEGEPLEVDPDEASGPVTSADAGPGTRSVAATPRRVRKDYLRKEVPSWTL